MVLSVPPIALTVVLSDPPIALTVVLSDPPIALTVVLSVPRVVTVPSTGVLAPSPLSTEALLDSVA